MKRTTIEEAQSYLKDKHGLKISIIDYYSMRDDAIFICNKCGLRWKTKAFSVLKNGTGCPNCENKESSRKQRKSYLELNNYLNNFGCFMSEENYISYKNIFSNIEITFYCGHTQSILFSNFIKYVDENEKVAVCGKCKKRMSWNKFHEENSRKVIEEIENLGFSFVRFIDDYRGVNSKIESLCSFGHTNIRTLDSYRLARGCSSCNSIEMGKRNFRENNPNWKNGISEISKYLRNRIDNWKKESVILSNGKCVITGDYFDDIHHLYSFELIVSEVLRELKIKNKFSIGEYSKSELNYIINLFDKRHSEYPLGVCLREDVHILFHQIYGSKNNTPDQFYDFVDRIESGEIIINK